MTLSFTSIHFSTFAIHRVKCINHLNDGILLKQHVLRRHLRSCPSSDSVIILTSRDTFPARKATFDLASITGITRLILNESDQQLSKGLLSLTGAARSVWDGVSYESPPQ